MNKPDKPKNLYVIRTLIFICGFALYIGFRVLDKLYLNINEFLLDAVISPLMLLGVFALSKRPFKRYYQALTEYEHEKITQEIASVDYSSGNVILDYGRFIKGLALVCVLLSVFFLYMYAISYYQVDKPGQTLALFGLIGGFGFLGIVTWLEAFCVKGSFNRQYIELKTPWNGLKKQHWTCLESVDFNPWMCWTVFCFSDGSKIRISPYLNNVRLLIAQLEELGFEV